ncbi:hypothetical protein A2524_03765 [Candidatus Wolfebacteria bacterium RIFOXYD12_FULL_48_21]|uniref:Type 4 fimbrial biogenesis protein PilO n=1 Tax=Candidatus Wolfebacteria bacterium RIFOXYD1_FULL_48_65 TaxID=1802561 RepID=A0A1F8E001_9BACT|nr:MAG: hypothetical protein A2610_04160 [Candidatus Wolfebacteria bacterium RIFOXYD1_FULL_48_65]OGM95168.1 MAG: hypothetical protein A2524_03765 [Candidatus Wolfebacteria bacterium RIFOXYD12_FULL_48_21]
MDPKKYSMRALAIALAIIFVLSGGIWYVRTDIKTRTNEIGQMRFDMQNREMSVAALARLQSDAEKAKRYLPYVEQMRTTREQLLGFSTDIGFLARQAGFSGTPKFKETVAPQAGDLLKTNFSLTLEGRSEAANLGTFFELVEKSAYIVRFESISVSRAAAAISVSMEGYVISFK